MLLLMRHGPTNLNSPDRTKDRIRGWHDVPLSPAGHVVARSLARHAKRYPITSLRSSDLSRASDTAKTVGEALGKSVTLDHTLRPWDLGRLSGERTEKVMPLIKTLVAHPDMKAPGGESFASFMNRFLPKIAPLLKDEKLHGIVTHIRNIKALEAVIAGHGTLHRGTWNQAPSVEPGGLVYADPSHFVPLFGEGDESTGAGS